jgi:ABC-type antimicrobial peptide transport system permease subunit
VLYVVIAFGIFGTLIMMTNERRRENGMLLAVGMTRKRLGAVLFGETLLLGGLGAISGALISLPLVYYLTERPIRFSGRTAEVFIQFGFEPVFPATVDPIIFLQQAGIIFLLSTILGSYPYISALRMDPLSSMKNT